MVSQSRCELFEPNKYVEYVDEDTLELVHVDYFHDPSLGWMADGRLVGLYGGHPTSEWLQKNPPPKGR